MVVMETHPRDRIRAQTTDGAHVTPLLHVTPAAQGGVGGRSGANETSVRDKLVFTTKNYIESVLKLLREKFFCNF